MCICLHICIITRLGIYVYTLTSLLKIRRMRSKMGSSIHIFNCLSSVKASSKFKHIDVSSFNLYLYVYVCITLIGNWIFFPSRTLFIIYRMSVQTRNPKNWKRISSVRDKPDQPKFIEMDNLITGRSSLCHSWSALIEWKENCRIK